MKYYEMLSYYQFENKELEKTGLPMLLLEVEHQWRQDITHHLDNQLHTRYEIEEIIFIDVDCKNYSPSFPMILHNYDQ
jgi:hypothetical protein